MSLVVACVLEVEAYGARLLRLEHEQCQVPFDPQRCKVLYAVGRAGCTGLNSEECVVSYGNQVVWTSGRAVRKRLTVESEVLQVCWVNFADQSHQSTVQSSSSGHAAAAGTGTAGPQQSPAAVLAAQLHARERSASPLGLSPAQTSFPASTLTPAVSQTNTSGPAAAAGCDPGFTTPASRAKATADAAAAATVTAGPQGVSGAVLCLLHKASITCIHPSGEVLETPLLQPCHALWPLPSGLLLAGPADSCASLLTHPLEEPLPVVADCSLGSTGGRGNPAAFAGWSQERVVWSSRDLPCVATYNESRGRLNIWQMRPMPPEASGIGSSFDLPVVSPMGFLQPRTPAGTPAAGGIAGLVGTEGYGSSGGYTPAAYSGSLLGTLTQGAGPKTGGSSYANMSTGGGGSARRSSLRTPQGCLPASVFNPTPAQTPWVGGLGALGVLRPCFSNTTQAQQAMLLPGPDPPVMFKLLCREELVGGAVPHEACMATDVDACPLLCVLCKEGAQELLAFRLPENPQRQLVVKQAFRLPAIAAVSVTTNHSSQCSSRWPQIDLLVLQPSGNLLLHRGSYPLVTVTLQLPRSTLQSLSSAAKRQNQHAKACLQDKPAQSRPGTASSLGCRSMSEASDAEAADSDDMMMSPASVATTGKQAPAALPALSLNQQAASPEPNSQLAITNLSSAAGDRFSVHMSPRSAYNPDSVCDGHSASVRVKLGLSWLPGLPSQVLHALQEVLPEQVYLQQILGACLQQEGACSGHLLSEWRAIAVVILAWALNPNFLQSQQPQHPSLIAVGQDIAAPATSLCTPVRPRTVDGHDQTAARTPAADMVTEDMDMATPETAVGRQQLAGLQPFHQLQQRQITPGSACSDMSMGMSVDSGSLATASKSRRVFATPMSMSTMRVATRLRVGTRNTALDEPSSSADAYFPTAGEVATQGFTPSVQPRVQQAPKDEQQGFATPAQQPEQLLPPTADTAWKQLLASQQSQHLLRSLPTLCVAEHQQPEEAPDATRPVAVHQPQQVTESLSSQQQHQQVMDVLRSLHSVYEDCKLHKLRLHQLHLLGPVCWVLAGWLQSPVYMEHYERDSSPSGLAAAAAVLCKAAGAPIPDASSAANAVAEFQQHQQAPVQDRTPQRDLSAGDDAESLQRPGDILRCMQHLLSASGRHGQCTPWLVKRGSSTVQRSCQLMQIYELLQSCAKQCAKVALTAAARLGVSEQPASSSMQGFGSPLLDDLAEPTATGATSDISAPAAAANALQTGSSHSVPADATSAKLQHILLVHSHRLVLMLVEQGWDVVALDSLPIGVALPVREAMLRCRTNPPTGWPISAYALIGREDIAATLASNSGTVSAAARATCVVGASSTGTAVVPQQQTGIKSTPRQGAAASSSHPAPADLISAAPSSLQHLLLPYEQRLLMPCSSHTRHQGSYQQQKHGSESSAGSKPAPGYSRRGSRAWGRGLRASASSGPASTAAAEQPKMGPATEFAAPVDGMDGLMDGVARLRFGRDQRLLEVRALLSTHMPVALPAPSSDSDPDLQAKQQAVLLSAAMRTMAMPLGRGALTLGLTQPLPGEHLAVPLLCLSGIVPGPRGDADATGGRMLISLDLQAAQAAPGAAADVTAWCEFHNGVAAGLKVAPRRNRANVKQQHMQGGDTGGGAVQDAWLPHSKRTVPNYGHAGVLLGLGLQGHLDRLSWTDLYRFLSDQHDATTIGVLLGMSACCRGSADTTVARMLFLHLPARHPNTFPEIELSPHVQAASLLGLGLLYQGSCHRLMTETMLEEIGRTPGVNPSLAHMTSPAGAAVNAASLSALMCVTHDREAYALAAGFALGLICLGQGRNAPGLADLHLEDKLRSFMDVNTQHHVMTSKPPAAGKHSDSNKASSNKPQSLLDSILGSGVVTWDPLFGGDPSGQVSNAAASAAVNLDSEQQQQYGISQVVLEGPGVNSYVSGPAAAMALMMMYMKTGDADIAAKFQVPSTVYALDHMRPDMVLLMALGGPLIMWDNISASQEWLDQQLPPLLDHPLSRIMDNMLSGTPGRSSDCQSAHGLSRSLSAGQALDWGAIGVTYVHALSGACLALGLRFAGTCNAAAEGLLRHHLLQLLNAKRRAPGGPNDQSIAPVIATAAAAAGNSPNGVGVAMSPAAAAIGKLDKQTLENSICTVLLALALVMAGSGHLPTFRLVQALSRRSAGPLRTAPVEGQPLGGIAALLNGPGMGTGNINYGNHLAVGLAAGLLFLSGGQASISTSNESIAALLIALYPVWPCSPTDHRSHLQAFRHLYVLAAEPRCLQAVDVHSRKQVAVPLEVAAHKQGICGQEPVTGTAAAATANEVGSGEARQDRPGVQGLLLGTGQHVEAAAAIQQHTQPNRVSVEPETAPSQLHPQQHTDCSACGSVSIKRYAPCLLPEREHLQSLRVCGPRYWPVAVAAGTASSVADEQMARVHDDQQTASSSWSQLYLQQRIFVKKKAGSLPYTDDPSGVKSLLFKAFYSGSRPANRGTSGALVLAEDGAASNLAPENQDQDQQHSLDIVHVCSTFSADPHILAFAQVLQAAAAGLPAGSDGQADCAGAFVHFCHGALYECIVEEKTAILPWYMQLYSVVHRVCGAAAELRKVDGSAGWHMLGGFGPLPVLPARQDLAQNGLQASLSPSVQLRDLQLVLTYNGSSVAAAASACRDAARVNNSRTAISGAPAPEAPLQQQQNTAGGWDGEALSWLPVIQPAFCESLLKGLQRHWRGAAMLPTAVSELHVRGDPGPSDRQTSMLQGYLSSGGISTAVAAASAAAAPAHTGHAAAVEQLLGCCLAMMSIPPAHDVQAAVEEVMKVEKQQTVRQLVPLLARQLPELSPTACGVVAAALQPGMQ